MKLHIEIDMDGAAFAGHSRWHEISHLLMMIPDRMRLYKEDSANLMDSNGNTCGRAWTTED